MRRLLFRTAGESHGRGLLAFLEGVPHGVPIDLAAIDAALKRRQGGYGRSRRQQIEADQATVLAGAKRGRTLGGPLVFMVANKDVRIDDYRALTRPRPGHADLPGAIRFEIQDVSDVMERASARETAARVAAGAFAQTMLAQVGIDVFGFVRGIGEVSFSGEPGLVPDRELRDRSPFFSLDPAGDLRAAALVEAARADGDTLGGRFEVRASGVPAGLGSHTQWDQRLDGRLAQAVMSIQGIKAVEIGDGSQAAVAKGLTFQDPIVVGAAPGPVARASNHAGGLEGGMTDGEAIVVRAAMKPIPTVGRPLPSVDLTDGQAAPAIYERSDVCSVPAASVVGEAMVSLILLDALLDAVPAANFDDFRAGVRAWRERAARVTRPPAPGLPEPGAAATGMPPRA